MTIGTNKKDNQRKEPKTSSSVQPTKKKSAKDKPVTKATAAKDAHDKKAHDEELEGKKKKREENKQKREDEERKRKAELEQAKENVQYFVGIPTLPSSFSPPKSPLVSNSTPKKSPLLSDQSSPLIHHLPPIQSLDLKKTKPPYHSSPKKPRHDFDEESLSSYGELSDDDDERKEHDDISADQSCSKCPTLEKNVESLERKVMILKRKLMETKNKWQDKECGAYTLLVNEMMINTVHYM